MTSRSTATSLSVTEISDPGSRDHNEDCGLALVGRSQHILAVADGMGGHAAGEIASQLAIDTFATFHKTDYSNSDLNPNDLIHNAITSANQAIRDDARENPSREGMGSTCVFALIRGRKLSIGHVGDSRAYLVRGGGIRQLTRDHSFVEEMVKAGMITPHETHTNPQRNVILQSLGCSDTINIDVNENTVNLKINDYVLLCSDGLTAVVADQEIAEIVERLVEPRIIAEELVNLTNRRGGPDNVTVVIGRFDGDLMEGPPVAVMCEDENAIDLYRLILQREGFRIQNYNSKSASELRYENPPTLIIIDNNDDPENIVVICNELKRRAELKNTPIILVTDGGLPSSKAGKSDALLHSKSLLADLLPKIRELINRSSPKVYILEGEPGLSKGIDQSLSQAGLSIRTFNTERDLMNAVSKQAPRMLLLHMNNSPRLEPLCRQLKTNPATQRCPIVLTAEGAVSDPRQAFIIGADYYLPNISDLVNLSQMILSK